MTVADFDLDGPLDVAVMRSVDVATYLGRGDGTFRPQVGLGSLTGG